MSNGMNIVLILTSLGLLLTLQLMHWLRTRRVSRRFYQHLRHMESLWSAVQTDVRARQTEIRELRSRLHYIEERQDTLDISEKGEQAYRLAIRLAQQGASLEDLTVTCGVTRGEAELLSLLHKHQRREKLNS